MTLTPHKAPSGAFQSSDIEFLWVLMWFRVSIAFNTFRGSLLHVGDFLPSAQS